MRRTLFTIALCSLVAPVFAQDRATNQFPKNFVGGMKLEKGPDIKARANVSRLTKKSSRPNQSRPLPPSNPEDGAEALKKFSGNFAEVKALGAFIWAGDWDHFQDKLDEVAQVSVDHNIPMSEVVIVAPPDKMVAIMMQLNMGALAEGQEEDDIKRAARVVKRWRLLPRLPENYAYIERSPTWMVHTEYGNFLLEGTTKSLDKYMVGDGQFDLGPYKLMVARKQNTQEYSGVEK